MDRHRGDRYGGGGRGSGGGGNGYRNNYSHEDSQGQDFHRDIRRPSRFSDGPSRFSDGPPMNPFPDNVVSSEGSYNNRSSHGYRAGGGGGGKRAFESPPQLPPGGFGGTGGFPSMGAGGGFRQVEDGDGGGGHFGATYPGLSPPPPLSGQKRSHPMSGRGGSPTSDRSDGGNFAKLFVGSVPRTATEEEIRPLFEKEGNVIEVALIKDKRTGQQQGCCFVKYATIEEADRAVRALHNQHTLPGGVGPIQVRYADGERERLGAVEYKLFVGSLNKQATEKEVEEIFAPYGRVEDVYLMRDEMKQSRGCGFVKYSQRDTALAAINSLNGTYTMRGCNQPLTVRFADPKRPKPGDSSLPRRGGPGFEDPGFGSQFQVPIPRPEHNYGGSMGDRAPPNPWHPITPKQTGPPPGAGVHGLGNPLPPFNQGGFGGPPDGTSQEAFFSPGNRPLQQVAPTGQQIQPTQKPVRSPQSLQASLPLNPHVASNYSQTQMPHPGQQNLPSYSQALPSQQLHGFTAPAVSAAAPTNPLTISLQSQSRPGAAPNPPQQSAPAQQQPQPLQQQSPSQLAQMLCQQKQTLQASFQSSQQAFSQLQQQVQMMQSSSVHQNPQAARSQWAGMPQHTVASSPATTLALDVPPTAKIAPVAQPAAAKHSNWTEHTSPEGFKYYYNNVTGESQWEKPDELISTEQQQSQTKPLAQLPQAQQNPGAPQNHQAVHGQSMHPGAPQNQQAGQGNPMQFPAQFQTQYRPQHPTQQPSFHSGEHGYAQMPVPADSANDQTKLQFQQAAQDWMWKNKPTGS